MPSVLSDFNTQSVKPANVAKTQLFTDLSLGMETVKLRKVDGEFVGDLAVLSDIDAVKNAVRILVLSNFHERPFAPFKGANLTGLLFENVDPITASVIRSEILRVIEEYEPRVSGVDCEVVDQSEVNAYRVSLTFNVISRQTNAEVNFYLKLIR